MPFRAAYFTAPQHERPTQQFVEIRRERRSGKAESGEKAECMG
jgi:hypothetical protein